MLPLLLQGHECRPDRRNVVLTLRLLLLLLQEV
jgi:hypothetical protein